jgi:hypothetical protein
MYLESILWYLSLPVLVFVAYHFIRLNLNFFEKNRKD